jgi:hypothetical protein
MDTGVGLNSWNASNTGVTMNSLRAFSLSKTCCSPRLSMPRSQSGAVTGGIGPNRSAGSGVTARTLLTVSTEKSLYDMDELSNPNTDHRASISPHLPLHHAVFV